ncbi:YigZ family protein [Rhizobium sp. RU36D]|uniref:IMPACT family protein n=1 Tax=Rhizobium sp. RU36D TaxID=1907415 RepID=UPI0009D7BC4A|nr:YigZ family protein [Rhizobium sp. RU36D]SMC76464.1 uncharacterized protein, YigZ family [Rhizobium sp. RU36D]
MFTLSAPCTFAQDIKRSQFIAHAGPIVDEQSARDFIALHSSPDANHNCWAWRDGQAYRFSDDGEPSGTAGKPILQAIDGQDLDKVVVVVTRHFGGILLGSGGLMRAYGGTAAQCLQSGTKVRIIPTETVFLQLQFSDLALVKSRLLATPDVDIANERFTATGAVLEVRLPLEGSRDIRRLVTDMTSGRAMIEETP